MPELRGFIFQHQRITNALHGHNLVSVQGVDLFSEFGETVFRRENKNICLRIIFEITCDDTICGDTFCSFNHDGIFAIAHFGSERTLAICCAGIGHGEQ